MDKAKLHHYWIAFRRPSLYILLASTLLCSAVAVYALRANNLRMIELKQAVYIADEQNGDIEAALQNLRDFVTTHMNTQMRSPDASEPPIQLVNQFNRLLQAEQARLASQDTSQVYRAAQQACESGAIPLTARAQCIQEYVIANGVQITESSLPPKELYTFDFASPRWSFDLAGISIVLAVLSALLLVVRVIVGRIAKQRL